MDLLSKFSRVSVLSWNHCPVSILHFFHLQRDFVTTFRPLWTLVSSHSTVSSIKKWKSRKKKKSNRDKSLSKKTYRIPMHLKAEPDSHLPDKCRKSLSIVDWMSSIKKVHLDILILWSIKYVYATYSWFLITVKKIGQGEVQSILMEPKVDTNDKKCPKELAMVE